MVAPPGDGEKISCLFFIKNREVHRRAAGESMTCSGRRGVRCLVPSRRTRSREELGAADSEATPRPFLPQYESTGSSRLQPQTAELWTRGSPPPALPVSRPAPRNGKMTRQQLQAIGRHLLIVPSSHSFTVKAIQQSHVTPSHNSQDSEEGGPRRSGGSHMTGCDIQQSPDPVRRSVISS